MRTDATTVRRILRTAMAVTAAVLIAAILLASLPLAFGGMTFEEETPLSAEISGFDIVFDGTYSVTSSLPSDVTDLSLRADLVDPFNGSTLLIYESSGMNVPAASSVDIAIHAEVPLALMTIVVRDLSEQTPFEIPLSIQLSGKYMFGMLGVSSETVIALPVSEDGEDFSFDYTASQSRLDIEVLGLREGLVPPSDHIVMSYGEHRVDVVIDSQGSRVAVSVDSGGEGLADAFRALIASYDSDGPLVYSETTGAEYDIDKETMASVGALVGYMVVIYESGSR